MQLDGVLSFPVSAFGTDGEIDLEAFRDHVARQVAAGPGALFACCGTGEFFSLDPDEYARLIEAAVEVVDGAMPVFAGAGYGIRQARPYLQAARTAGLSGLLVLPPYLVTAPQEGLVAYYEAIADESGLPIIAYQRDNARLRPETVVRLAQNPAIIGIKDGLGDAESMIRIASALRESGHDDFQLLNGTPTAEILQPAYAAIGVSGYSSAVHCFAPDISHGFYGALQKGDAPLLHRYLDEFFRPLVQLRGLGAGYAVSLVKAAVRSSGIPVGSVRAPLQDPAPEHRAELDRIIRQGRAIG